MHKKYALMMQRKSGGPFIFMNDTDEYRDMMLDDCWIISCEILDSDPREPYSIDYWKLKSPCAGTDYLSHKGKYEFYWK